MMPTLGSTVASLQTIRRYCRRFGLIDGINFYYFSNSPGRLLKLELHGLPAPFYLRSGTSDIAVVKQTFLDSAHNAVALDPEPCTIIDLGANIGLVAVYYANLYPKATVIAVEPDPENFDLLLKNTGPYGNIRLLQAAAWGSNTPLRVEGQGRDYWSRTVRPTEASRDDIATVPGITISELMRRFDLSSIDLLKVDIEGAEKEIFASNHEGWLGATKAILIELHDRFVPGCSNAFFKAIVGRPFAHSQIGEYTFVQFGEADSGTVQLRPLVNSPPLMKGDSLGFGLSQSDAV
jgi:FkbM family methyltransferase